MTEFAMLRAATLLALVSLGFAEHQSRCGQEIGTTIEESGDDIQGRYTIEWCHSHRDASIWDLQLKYINFNDTSAPCPEHSVRNTMKYQYIIHSYIQEPLERSNCNITCLSKPLDLIFSGCYEIVNQMRGTFNKSSLTALADFAVHRVHNRFRSAQDFNRLEPVYFIEKDSDTIAMRWDLHYIPVEHYSVEINENEKIRELKNEDWVGIRENCTEERFSVTCRARAPRPGRCLGALLRHAAPWRAGTLFKDNNLLVYCAPAREEVTVERRYMDARVWVAAGVAGAALCALAALWALHRRVLAALRRKVLETWTRRVSSHTDNAVPSQAEAGPILLLYARDCPAAMAAVAELRAVLEAAAPARVYDIFTSRCVAEYAADPVTWLRGKLARRDARVVLLQTPAAAALYDAPRDDRLQEPLLGNLLQYRRPHYGDALLGAALRLLRDSAHRDLDYTKYYVATVADLESELMSELVPFRRYELPALAPTLLHDLRLPPPSAESLARLAASLERLRDFVRDNQDYLRDELVFLPPRVDV